MAASGNANDSLASFLREQLAPLGHIATRRMFGAMGVFCNGLMFGLISRDTLWLRVDAMNQAAFENAEGTHPLTYNRMGREASLPYWRIPDSLFDEPDALLHWARDALAAARRVAAAKKPAAPRGKSKVRSV